MGSSLPLPTHLGFLQIVKPILALESEYAVGYVLSWNIYAIVGTKHLSENAKWQRKERV
jgi:hypothetical protein